MSDEAPRDNLRGGAWLLADMSLNIWALSIVKWLGAGYPATQVVFIRALVGLCLIAPLIWRDRARFRALPDLPRISKLFSAGKISYSKVRAMTRVATQKNEDALLMVARHGTASHVEKQVQLYRRVKRIEALAKAAVARCALDPIEGPEVGARGGLLAAVVIELQQRGVLQPEQRQPRHQMIDQGDCLARRVGDRCTDPPRLAQQPLGAEVFTANRCTHQDLPRSLRFAWQYTDSARKVCEELFVSPT